MKRLLFAGLLALGFACTARPARADCAFDYSCCRQFHYVHTSKQYCLTLNCHSNPLPCAAPSGGYGGPAMWDGLAAYGAAPYGYPAYAAAPYAVAPAAPTPAPAAPSYKGPPPKSAAAANGVQQAGYFYYAPTANVGYGAGYSYYGYGSGSYQAPNYWYDN